MLWYGTEVNIPSGWHACDGSMGTPDLRGRFIPCAAPFFDPHTEGGSASHSHTFTGDGHDHDIPSGTGIGAGVDFYPNTDLDPAVGTTDTTDTRPLFHVLWYIMKL